jgi:hypothetical protein
MPQEKTKFLVAVCEKHTKRVLAWYECEANSMFNAIDQSEKEVDILVDGSTNYAEAVVIDY